MCAAKVSCGYCLTVMCAVLVFCRYFLMLKTVEMGVSKGAFRARESSVRTVSSVRKTVEKCGFSVRKRPKTPSLQRRVVDSQMNRSVRSDAPVCKLAVYLPSFARCPALSNYLFAIAVGAGKKSARGVYQSSHCEAISILFVSAASAELAKDIPTIRSSEVLAASAVHAL